MTNKEMVIERKKNGEKRTYIASSLGISIYKVNRILSEHGWRSKHPYYTTKKTKNVNLDTEIEEWNISYPVYLCLRRSGIQTVNDINNRNAKIRGLGKKGLNEILHALGDRFNYNEILIKNY